jgi:hypothetical protein
MTKFLTVLSHIVVFAAAGYSVYRNPSSAITIIPTVLAAGALPSTTQLVKDSVTGQKDKP